MVNIFFHPNYVQASLKNLDITKNLDDGVFREIEIQEISNWGPEWICH